jgi:tripartite-type tricarboxylate transporter receptor subunit TctC
VQSASPVVPLVKPHVANGRMRAIGISSGKRASIMPDIPTLQAQGVAAFEALQWRGYYFVPARAPAAITSGHQEINESAESAVSRRLWPNTPTRRAVVCYDAGNLRTSPRAAAQRPR